MRYVLTAVLLLSSLHLYAEKKHVVQRLADGDLIPVRTKVRFTTLIVLPEGEEISEITCGDKEYWAVEGKDGNVHVKPAKEGATTNLNVIAKSKTVYSFLLEEISGSKTKPSREKPDLIVRVDPEELSQLRKDKNDLSELLSRTERELNEQKEKAAAAEKATAKKKEETVTPTNKVAETSKATAPMPVFTERGIQGTGTKKILPAPPAEHPQPEKDTPLTSVYTVTKPRSVFSTSKQAVSRLLNRVGRFLRII